MFWSMCCGFFGTQPGHELSLVHLSPTRGPMLVRRVVGPLAESRAFESNSWSDVGSPCCRSIGPQLGHS
jgi:hypothetical protein